MRGEARGTCVCWTKKPTNFTQAAHAVGVSEPNGKVWRNGRNRATGEEQKGKHGLVSFHHGQNRTDPRAATSIRRSASRSPTGCARAIRSAPSPGCRDATPARVSREVERNSSPGTGDCEPCRAQQKAAGRLKRPRPRKAADGTPLWAEIPAGSRRHWSPEQISNRPRRRTGRSPATGRAISSPAAATKARSACCRAHHQVHDPAAPARRARRRTRTEQAIYGKHLRRPNSRAIR